MATCESLCQVKNRKNLICD